MDTHLEGADQPVQRERERRARPTRGRLVIRLAVMAALLIVVFGGFYAFERFREQAIANFFAHNKPPPLPVAAVTATASAMPRTLAGIGSLAAVHQVAVAPEVGGRVTAIHFESGTTVRTGDPLVQINDDPDKGDLANFEAQARLALTNLGRASSLARRQFETQANVDTYQAQLDQANAAIAKTRAIIAEKLVRAPFSGILGIRQVDLGQYVNAGSTLVTLTNLDTLYINFTLPEQARAQLSVGQTVDLAVDAFPHRSFAARLTTIEPQVSADTRTIKLQATLANADHLLLPGMFAQAQVVLPAQPDVVSVPETAVEYTLYGDSVFLVERDPASPADKPAFRARRIFVRTGDHFGDRVAVLSGVRPGERVVASGQLKLIDGAAVEPQPDTLAVPATVPTN